MAVAVLSLGAIIALARPQPWLEIRHGANLRAVYPGDNTVQFAVRWTHSVEHEDWIECFRVIDGRIDIAATRFKTFGAGVPSHAGRQTRLDEGWVVMSDIDRDVDPLAIQAASAERYRFRYARGAWQRLSGNGAAPILTFRVVKASWFSIGWARLKTRWRGVATNTEQS